MKREWSYVLMFCTTLLCITFIFWCANIINQTSFPKSTTEIETRVETEYIVLEQQTIIDNNLYTIKNIPLSQDLQDFISMCSNYYKIPVPLIYAIIETESSYDADVVSITKDYGLMQVNEEYYEFYIAQDTFLYETYQLDTTNWLDPYTNIVTGCNAYTYWSKEAERLGFLGFVDVLNMYNNGYKYIHTKNTSYSDKVIVHLKNILRK